MGMLDQRGEMFWIKYSRADRPILERTGTLAGGIMQLSDIGQFAAAACL